MNSFLARRKSRTSACRRSTQLKRVNLKSAETAVRVADLEGFRSKVSGTGNSIGNSNGLIGDTTPKGDAVDLTAGDVASGAGVGTGVGTGVGEGAGDGGGVSIIATTP